MRLSHDPDRAGAERSLRLHERIAQRFEVDARTGLIGELRRLRERFELDPSLPSMRSVGYRQVWQYLEGEFGLATLREKGAAATRQLAKRQLTWLRSWGRRPVASTCLADGPRRAGRGLSRRADLKADCGSQPSVHTLPASRSPPLRSDHPRWISRHSPR